MEKVEYFLNANFLYSFIKDIFFQSKGNYRLSQSGNFHYF
jgi:hypothetical protein